MRLPNILWDHRNKLIKRIELIYVQESEEKAKNIKNIITRHGYDNDHDVSTLVIQEKLMFRGREEIVPPGIKVCPVMSSDYSKPVKLGQ
ncbi:hypothetical protein YC2023_107886 [Brassica napus]